MQYNDIHSCPASQALTALEHRLPEPEYYTKRVNEVCSSYEQSPCKQRGSKRQKSSPLDMMDVLSSIKSVEDSIAFPTIEWSYDDFDQEDESLSYPTKSCCTVSIDEDDPIFSPLSRLHSSTSSCGKRSNCGGLIRSKTNKIPLSSLVSSGSSS
jgi:hypothetical protein